MNIVKYQAKQRCQDFEYYLSNQVLKSQLYGDPLRVQQILLYLIGNAIKFTLHGTITLSISVEEDFSNSHTNYSNTKAVFKISDTGVGIKEENLKQIFDPF